MSTYFPAFTQPWTHQDRSSMLCVIPRSELSPLCFYTVDLEMAREEGNLALQLHTRDRLVEIKGQTNNPRAK